MTDEEAKVLDAEMVELFAKFTENRKKRGHPLTIEFVDGEETCVAFATDGQVYISDANAYRDSRLMVSFSTAMWARLNAMLILRQFAKPDEHDAEAHS